MSNFILQLTDGKKYINEGEWDSAIEFLKQAEDYSDSRELLKQAYEMKVSDLLERKSLSSAYSTYREADANGIKLTDAIIIKPGDSSEEAMFIINMAKDLGYIKKIPKGETVYQESYAEGIRNMEAFFGLTPDGIIHMTEYGELKTVLYPGCSADASAALERLWDLGYISVKLPDEHHSYDKKYSQYVIKAEKALDLTADGILRPDEQKVIFQQEVTAPGLVIKLTAKAENGIVSLNWPEVKGAVYYEIFRDSSVTVPNPEKMSALAVVSGTSYKDKTPEMGRIYVYRIRACNYSTHSYFTKTKDISVEIFYKAVSASELEQNGKNYEGQYVKINSLYIAESTFSGNDLYVLAHAGSGYIFLVFENYYNWNFNEGLGLYGKTKIKYFWVNGKVTKETRKYGRKKLPVIKADEIRYYY